MDKMIKKYIVNCPYCEKDYTIEAVAGTEFRCPSCGGAGTLQNATEVKEQPKEKIVYVTKKEKADDSEKPDWYGENGKAQDYESETENDKIAKVIACIGIIFFLIICLGIGISSKVAQKRELEEQLAAKNPLAALRTAGDETEDAEEIRKLVKDFINALAKEDYTAIKEMSYKDDRTKDMTEEEWKTLIQNSVFGKYLGDDKITVEKTAYMDGFPLPGEYAVASVYFEKDKTKEWYQNFSVTLSDGKKYEVKFLSKYGVKWEICFWE